MRQIKEYGFAVVSLLAILIVIVAIFLPLIDTAQAVPRSAGRDERGAFTGPRSGTAQDDNIKGSLDLAHTDLDAIIANQAGTGALIAGQVYVSTSSEIGTEASPNDVFVVAGGPIEIISCYGVTLTDMAGSPGDLNLEIDATTSDYDADFTTAVTIDALNLGDICTFDTVTSGESVLVPTTGVNAGLPLRWYCPVGTIEQATTSTGTGGISWVITFRPLTDGVTVTAQ